VIFPPDKYLAFLERSIYSSADALLFPFRSKQTNILFQKQIVTSANASIIWLMYSMRILDNPLETTFRPRVKICTAFTPLLLFFWYAIVVSVIFCNKTCAASGCWKQILWPYQNFRTFSFLTHNVQGEPWSQLGTSSFSISLVNLIATKRI
jgi:hypothetical protein